MMTKGGRLFVILSGLYIGFLILAELIGGKLFTIDVASTGIFPAIGIDAFTMTLGVIPFPITFIITDLLNEYYGQKSVRFTVLLGMAVLLAIYGLIFVGIAIPAADFSPVSDEAFLTVFANSQAIILASIVAYLIGQLIDIKVFHRLRVATHGRHIWLRATGSTIISQLIDSFVVIYLAFGSPLSQSQLGFDQVLSISATNFVYKMIVAIAITPLIYLGHNLMSKYLGKEADTLRERAQNGKTFVAPFSPG